MGTINHDIVIAEGSDYQGKFEAAVEDFRRRLEQADSDDAFHAPLWPGLLLGPAKGINGTLTVVFAPDGSKEWWGTSDTGDILREVFVDTMRPVARVIHLAWGELTDGRVKLVGDSEASQYL